MTVGLSTLSSQAAFRVLLDTLARPGRVRRLDVPLGVPAPLMLPLALADVTQRVAVVGEQSSVWEGLLVSATACRIVRPEDADQVVALDGAATPELIARLRRGSALVPEEGARLAIGCASLGCPADVASAINEANRHYPAGIDVWFIDRDGAVAGHPRSATLEVPAWVT
jgi:alpha-D-ribose 1-methylphosphonate 5-triphosphate synthase subunit PhnH